MPEGRLSINDKISTIMKTFRGKLWFAKVGMSIKKKMAANSEGKEAKPAGFDVDMKGMMGMLGGFTVLRLTSMMGMMNISFTKEELLAMNAKLNKIRRPKDEK